MFARSPLITLVIASTVLIGCAAPRSLLPKRSPPSTSTTSVQKVADQDCNSPPRTSNHSDSIRLVGAEEPDNTGAAKQNTLSPGSVPAPVFIAQPEETPPDAANSDKPEELPAAEPSVQRPAYAMDETIPIDLPTVIRLVDENSPTVGFAQARVREATARRRGAELQWLPNLSVGSAYNRFDGQTQNQHGDVFSVSRSNLFGGTGAAVSLDFADAIYRPLIERRLESAEQLRTSAAVINSELDAVLAYLDLVQIHSQLAINTDTLAKAESMLSAAMNAKEAKLDRTAGDVNRARAEVLFRRNERLDLQGKGGAASAKLVRLLLLSPNVKLAPLNPEVVPITLVDSTTTLDELITIAIENRPDIGANRELLAAAWDRVRKAERGPLFPKLMLVDQGGTFGGGINGNLQNFNGRNVLSAQIVWELKNLGFGNRLETYERRAVVDQARFQLVEIQARLTAEVVESAQVAAAKYESLALAEQAVKEATELYRINKEGTFNVVDAKNLFDALRPLQAIQTLNQARVNYLTAVLDFNRAQYRLYAALGYPTHVSDVLLPLDEK